MSSRGFLETYPAHRNGPAIPAWHRTSRSRDPTARRDCRPALCWYSEIPPGSHGVTEPASIACGALTTIPRRSRASSTESSAWSNQSTERKSMLWLRRGRQRATTHRVGEAGSHAFVGEMPAVVLEQSHPGGGVSRFKQAHDLCQ